MVSPQRAAFWLWLIWFCTWWIAAVWASRAVARPKLGAGALHRVFASAGFLLLFLDHFFLRYRAHPRAPIFAGLTRPLWAEPALVGWALVVLVVLSFGFCWWARLHLGKLWSGLTTVKADHRVVDTGPYRLVRHPIYTGLVAAALFTAAIEASVSGMLGFGLIALGFWMTARIEEAFLRQELGTGPYDAYARRTPMLIPGLR